MDKACFPGLWAVLPRRLKSPVVVPGAIDVNLRSLIIWRRRDCIKSGTASANGHLTQAGFMPPLQTTARKTASQLESRGLAICNQGELVLLHPQGKEVCTQTKEAVMSPACLSTRRSRQEKGRLCPDVVGLF